MSRSIPVCTLLLRYQVSRPVFGDSSGRFVTKGADRPTRSTHSSSQLALVIITIAHTSPNPTTNIRADVSSHVVRTILIPDSPEFENEWVRNVGSGVDRPVSQPATDSQTCSPLISPHCCNTRFMSPIRSVSISQKFPSN